MKKLRILCVFGTRPEAIKMCPIVLCMKAASKRFEPIVCVTGQHSEMLRQVLDTFGVRPDHDLAIMRPDQTLTGLTSRILRGVDKIIEKEKPDLVLVQGDTTTAFGAALAALYHRVPVGHVEAGLRTGDFENPFPEELNRTLIDRFARFCFAPTQLNRQTLLAENVPAERIHVTGNTGIDALLLVRERVRQRRASAWPDVWGSAAGALGGDGKLVLVTAHRRESFGARLNAMLAAIRALADRHPDWNFIYPVHLNPNVRKQAGKVLDGARNIHLLEPLPYEPFAFLMERASLIVTDSGGVQEEAPSLGKPVVVMRETTERTEALKAGMIALAGNTGHGLEETVERLMANGQATQGPLRRSNPYGDGRAAERILEIISKQPGKR